jgi:putative oxidoreductase
METALLYIGRILFGGYFIFGGMNHFTKLEMMSGYAKSKGAPLPKLSVAFSGLLLLIGGLSVMLNIFIIAGLASLILFLVPVTMIMHQFWKLQDAQTKMVEMVNFLKNLALLGAVFMLLAHSLVEQIPNQ